MRFDIVSYTDKGPRLVNEDAWNYHTFGADAIALCVADGVGGSPCGQAAARICAEKFIDYVSEPTVDFREIISRIDADVKQYAIKNPECTGLASTLSGCLLSEQKLTGVHIGDTRISILRGNGIKQLTQDHTEVARLVKEKLLKPDIVRFYHRRNVLEMALGANTPLTPDLLSFAIAPGDRILLTSDGVHTVINKHMFRDISVASPTLDDFASKIIERLLDSKLRDNVTFVAAQVNY